MLIVRLTLALFQVQRVHKPAISKSPPDNMPSALLYRDAYRILYTQYTYMVKAQLVYHIYHVISCLPLLQADGRRYNPGGTNSSFQMLHF